MCTKGFGVSLPCNFGVGSPSVNDARAWAYSWIPIDIARITASMMILMMLSIIDIKWFIRYCAVVQYSYLVQYYNDGWCYCCDASLSCDRCWCLMVYCISRPMLIECPIFAHRAHSGNSAVASCIGNECNNCPELKLMYNRQPIHPRWAIDAIPCPTLPAPCIATFDRNCLPVIVSYVVFTHHATGIKLAALVASCFLLKSFL